MFRDNRLHAVMSLFLAVVMIVTGFVQYQSPVPLGASGPENAVQATALKSGDEIVSARQENTKTYYLGENSYALEASIGAIHYKDNYADNQEQWKEIDLTFENGQITKAPYELTVDMENYSITVKDKKTGQVTSLKLIKVGDKDIKDIKKTASVSKGQVRWNDVDTDLDIAITPDNTRVNFDWIVKSENAPHEMEFEIEDGGIPILYRGFDADAESVNVMADKTNNKIIERIEKGGKYPKIINPSLDLQVSSSNNDGDIHTAGDYNPTIGADRVGYVPIIDGTIHRLHSWYRWTGFTIPVGCVINSNSYISLYANSHLRWPDTRIYFDDEASPSYPASQSDYLTRPVTTHYLAWTPAAWTYNTWVDSPSIQNIVQELVDSYGDLSVIQCLHKDYTPTNDLLQRKILSLAYDYSTSNAPKLHIEYKDRWYAGNTQYDTYGAKADISTPSSQPSLASGMECAWVSTPAPYWAQTGWRYDYGTTSAYKYIEVNYPGYYRLISKGSIAWNSTHNYLVAYQYLGYSGWSTFIDGVFADHWTDASLPVPPTWAEALSEVTCPQNSINTTFTNVSYLDSSSQWNPFTASNWSEDSPYICSHPNNEYTYTCSGP